MGAEESRTRSIVTGYCRAALDAGSGGWESSPQPPGAEGEHRPTHASSPIPGRKQDTFGLAGYYLGFSGDFKDVARVITPVRDEGGLELFYNAAVTPWCHLTTDVQVITPALGHAKTSLVLGLRMKIDF